MRMKLAPWTNIAPIECVVLLEIIDICRIRVINGCQTKYKNLFMLHYTLSMRVELNTNYEIRHGGREYLRRKVRDN